jgi:carbonic anhydrase
VVERYLSRREWLGVAGMAAAATVVAACGSRGKSSAPTAAVTVPAPPDFNAEHAEPTIADPDAALKELMDGNKRFVDAQMVHPAQDPATRLRVSQGQRPFATILTCSDSRLPPEVIFDQGLGDLFVIRVAGNVVDPALLGSVEYSVVHLHAPLVLVIGHDRCGAVEATLENIQDNTTPHGDIAALVEAIKPAVPVAEERPGGLLDNTIRVNAEMSRDTIAKSSELEEPLKSGRLKVLAAYYGLDAGTVTLL